MAPYYTESELEDLRRRTSILPELFDYLSRPSRGVAEGTYRALEGEGLGGFVSGVGAGLKGETYTTGKDVVESAFGEDTPDWLSSTLGFGFDVVADPLTYVGVGLKKPTTANTPAALRARAVREAEKLFDPKTGKVSPSPLIKDYTAVQGNYEALVNTIAEDMAQDSAGYAYLSFMGKPVVKSRKAYDKITQSTKNLFTDSEGEYGLLAKAFSRQAEMPGGIADVSRRAEMAATEGMRRNMMKTSKWSELFTPEQRRLVSFALDGSDDYSMRLMQALPESKAAPNSYGVDNASDMAAIIQKQLAELFQTEVNAGILPATQKIDRYVHRVMRNRGKQLVDVEPKFPIKVTGRERQPFQYKREADISLREGEAAGLDPIVDWAEWLPIRYAQHFQAMAKARTYTDAIETFGIKRTKKNAEFLDKYNYHKVTDVLSHPMFKNKKEVYEDVYMPLEQMKALETVQGIFDNVTVASKAMRVADKALNEWRFLATLTPQTRIRNFFSDVIQNFSDGLYNPNRYGASRKVLQDVSKAIEADMAGAKFAGRKIVLDGVEFDTNLIWELYTNYGGKAGQVSSILYRDIVGLDKQLAAEAGIRSGLSSGYGKVKNVAGNLADLQEDYVRVAHFIDALLKRLPKGTKKLERNELGLIGKQLEKAALEAGDAVRRVNLDYGNKTVFEKKVMSRVIPFYSYLRQALPQQISLLFTNPGFMALYPKGQNLITNLMGADLQDPSEDPLVPQWITEMAPFRLQSMYQQQNQKSNLDKLLDRMGPVGSAARAGFGIQPGQDVMLTTAGMPVDILRTIDAPIQTVQSLAQGDVPSVRESLGETSRTFLGMSNPLLKNTAELATGKSVFTGQDLSEQGWADWLSKQIPQARLAYNVTSRATDPTRAPGLAGITQGGDIGRFLTGLDVRPISEGQRISEAIRRVDEMEKILSEYPRKKIKNKWVYEDTEAIELNKRKRALDKYIRDSTKASTGPSYGQAPGFG